MRFAKFFAVLNGLFYILFGLYWAFQPRAVGDLFGFELPGQLGMHEMRAYGMFFFAFGMMILGAALRRVDQRPLVLALMFVTMGFFAGRLLGLLLDGPGPMLTYYEMALEVVTICLGAIALRLMRPKTLA